MTEHGTWLGLGWRIRQGPKTAPKRRWAGIRLRHLELAAQCLIITIFGAIFVWIVGIIVWVEMTKDTCGC
jgi:hypothetical protein